MLKGLVRLLAAAAIGVIAHASSAMTINLVPDAGLSANPAALAAFQRAANTWQTAFSDPVTITLNAGLAGTFSSSSIIGQTSSVGLQAGYDTIRNAMVADGSAANPILASLPTSATFTATVPAGRSLSGNLFVSKANAKALGFTGLDASFGTSDGTITFNSNFSFDYDSSNGVTNGLIDFQTVATHEIGHALGFTSVVDSIDQTTSSQLPNVTPTTLDLFRFAGSSAVSATTFATGPRNLVPGAADVFSDASAAYAMSTGISNGDGNQASHWKNDGSFNDQPLNGNYIGIMDPTLPSGITEPVTNADLLAFNLIGYDLVPEPASLAFVGVGLLVLRRRRVA